MADSNRLIIRCASKAGKIAKIVFTVANAVVDPTAANIIALRDALMAICCVNQESASIGINGIVADVGAASAFNDRKDKILWLATDANGRTHGIETPCPLDTLFTADNVTVDMTLAPVIAWVAAVTTNLRTKAGDAFTGVVSGRRVMN